MKYELWDVDVGVGMMATDSESEMKAAVRLLFEAGHGSGLELLIGEDSNLQGEELESWAQDLT